MRVKRMGMREGRSALRKGLALMCAVSLAACAVATELEYLGKVYSYCKTASSEDGSTEHELEDSSQRFRLRSPLSRFPYSGTCYVAVPVTVKSGSAKPENVAVSLEGVVHPGELSAAKVYDDRAFMKMVCPADTSTWENGGDKWESESDNESREWPKEVWPNKTPVSDRYWFLAQLNGMEGNWSGLTHLRIEVRDDARGSFDPVVVPLWRAQMIDLPGDKIFGGSSMSMKLESQDMWVMFNDEPNGRVGIDYDIGYADQVGFQIAVREAGVLRVAYLGDGKLEAWGGNIVSKRDDTTSPSGIWWLEVEVSAATTLTIRGPEDICDVNIYEISFWPSGSRCARVAADYAERCDLDDGCGLPYLRGYVLGSGVYKSGETATLTAVAGNTAAFVRWESDEIALDPAVVTNAHLSFTVPDSVCAAAAARAEVRIRAVWRDRLPGEEPEPSDPEPGEGGLAESYGPFVPGEAVSLDVPALVGYKAKGLPSGLKLDAKTGRIAGAAKKPTGETGAPATFTKKGAPALTARFVVGPLPAVSVALAGDAAGCRVTGAGKACLAGKKVTLAAKAPKGTAFAGWTRDGAPWPDAGAASRAKLSFVMPAEGVALVASFERERMSLACPSLASASLSVGVAGDAGGYPLEIVTQSGVKSAKARGLPAGMRFAKDRETGAWRVVGAPRRAGAYEVELTATAASGAQERATFAVEVAPLPAWAVGTFGGEVDRPNADAEDESDEWRKYGTVTLKVSPAGKVTAKVLAGGRAWSFSADGFAAHDAARDAYRFRMETRAGDAFEGEILRDCHDVAALMGERRRDGGIDPDGTFAPAGREPYHVIVWRNENGRDGRLGADATGRARTALDAVKAAGRFALADVDPAWGTVSVTVDAKGNVKASGTTADGVKVSASGGFLALDDADPYMCASLVFHDRKTGLVYDCSPSWQPLFDAEGNLAGSAEDWVVPIHCDPYPFE